MNIININRSFDATLKGCLVPVKTPKTLSFFLRPSYTRMQFILYFDESVTCKVTNSSCILWLTGAVITQLQILWFPDVLELMTPLEFLTSKVQAVECTSVKADFYY